MSHLSQKRALHNYRRRLVERGMARFEVQGLDIDRDLIRSLARRLAEGDDGAAQLRQEITRSVAGEPPRRGGILAGLRRSPLVGAEVDLTRETTTGRTVDL